MVISSDVRAGQSFRKCFACILTWLPFIKVFVDDTRGLAKNLLVVGLESSPDIIVTRPSFLTLVTSSTGPVISLNRSLIASPISIPPRIFMKNRSSRREGSNYFGHGEPSLEKNFWYQAVESAVKRASGSIGGGSESRTAACSGATLNQESSTTRGHSATACA